MQRFGLYLFIFLHFLLASSIASYEINDTKLVLPRQQNCCWTPLVVSPECGEDGRTYVNRCTRICEDVALRRPGYCEFDPSKCVCSKIYIPECGTDQVTYANSCLRECSGVDFQYAGKCVEHPYNYDFCCYEKDDIDQCGVNGEVFESVCDRECKGVEEDETWVSCDDSYEY